MAMRFCILGSGSSGNCALLQTDQARVLIDAGFSARRTRELLSQAETRLEDIDAIFLTHEHGDHAAALSGLARFPQIKIYANAATARALQAGLSHRPDWQTFQTGARFRFRDLEIESFPVPHDAQEPVGFRFSHGEDDLFNRRRSIAWLTDLGYVPQNVRARLPGTDVVVIEANHCPELLKADARRPWSTKQRIAGRHGHLSNTATRELLDSFPTPSWQHVFLTHLSRDCNSLETVQQAFASFPVPCSIVPPGGAAPFFDLG